MKQRSKQLNNESIQKDDVSDIESLMLSLKTIMQWADQKKIREQKEGGDMYVLLLERDKEAEGFFMQSATRKISLGEVLRCMRSAMVYEAVEQKMSDRSEAKQSVAHYFTAMAAEEIMEDLCERHKNPNDVNTEKVAEMITSMALSACVQWLDKGVATKVSKKKPKGGTV